MIREFQEEHNNSIGYRPMTRLISEKIGKAIRVRMILREDAPLQKEKLAMVKVTEDRLRSHIAMDIETDPEEI